MDKKATIMGCGWLGFPLASRLITAGWEVKGTTTSQKQIDKLKNVGIDAYKVKLPSIEPMPPDLFDTEILVFNIPPGRNSPDALAVFPDVVNDVLKHVSQSPVKKIIFVSSTSVYGSKHDIITEETENVPRSKSGKVLLAVEELIKGCKKDWVILRFGGLAGPHRHPGRFLAGRKGLISGNQVINYLHLEDAIGVIMHFLNTSYRNQIFNVVSPKHPTKDEFYPVMAARLNVEPPEFTYETKMHKREVSVEKLIKSTGYNFVYPDPLKYEF